jgi:hypothetical protein
VVGVEAVCVFEGGLIARRRLVRDKVELVSLVEYRALRSGPWSSGSGGGVRLGLCEGGAGAYVEVKELLK